MTACEIGLREVQTAADFLELADVDRQNRSREQAQLLA